MKPRGKSPPEGWILLGIPMLFIIGTLFHFIYDWAGQPMLLGLLVPTNESVWEHIKMVVLPTMLWWLVYYRFKGSYYRINRDRWYTAAMVSLFTAMLVMPTAFYFYTCAFGVELLVVDILILLLAVACGQLLGLHFYRHYAGINWMVVSVIFVTVLMLFAMYTLSPPSLPIFVSAV